ncbi:glycosyltransferase [Pedobacter gandavensis]|uniref:glycosyltransferase n=1 Tax=Pedobacter gandavensis TaxID=2679963 RepID=UPI002930874E|nr:glycosyltransferase [Pedobacter gandavensis]
MSRKVLFIVGDFWPTRTGGTIRVEKLIKYLPAHDWKGVVFTKKMPLMNDYEQIDGTSIYRSNAYNLPSVYIKIKQFFQRKNNNRTPVLDAKVKPGTEKKNGTKSPAAAAGNANNRLADYVFVPDVDIFWALGALRKIRTTVKKEEIEVIYSSSPFASVHIAALLYRKFMNKSIKWVVEFRDPWTFNPFRNNKLPFFEQMDHKLESIVLKSCDQIIVTSEAYKVEFLEKYPSLPADKITFIPNGYDSDDFSSLKPKDTVLNSKLKIIHAGNFYGKRSIKPFLESLNAIYLQQPDLINKVLVTQYGVIDPDGEAYNLANPNPLFELKAAIPHKDSLQEIMNADWLLLVPGPGAGTMPGKLYEYLATGNPIIALVEEGPAKELILKLNIGYISSPERVDDLSKILLEVIEGRSPYKRLDNDSPELKRFDRKNIAQEVAQLLNV